ncbi:MAG: DUF58 domain-containing protein [Candidatus Eremiobacteraeota bacterium]|nr:DUF58 domain-containing protein [Candidatus Eremiobacteraeota bacterium]
MNRLWLPAWVSARFLWILAGVALLLACSLGVSAFVPLAVVVAIALAIAAIVDAIVGPRRAALRIVRTPSNHFALGRAAQLTYAIENSSPVAVRIGLIETPVRSLRFEIDELIAILAPRSRTVIARPLVPIFRGADELRALYVWYESPLGLIRRRLRIDAPEAIRIFPDLSAVERYGKLHLRNRTIEAGLRRMKLRGAGTEFESLREWGDGDAFRAIDWKATARRGKLMVAQHEVERSQNVMLLLDCGRLMTPRIDTCRKLDYAVTAALSLATIAGLASDRVGLVAFARDILASNAPRSTRSGVTRLSNALYGLEPRFEESNYTRAFAYLRHHLHKRSLIVLLTDVIDPLAQAAVMADVGSLAKHHLLVGVFMNDAAIGAVLSQEPETVRDAYRANVALELTHERGIAKAMLERSGMIVIDVPAKKLSTALIDEYLRVKRRGLL